jgi:transposase-like protein
MDPHQQWCHNPRCRAYGRLGQGHVVIHSQKERRYRCKRCGRTFAETKDTPLYRMHKPRWLVIAVVTLLAYGCPVQAIVAAFGLDERTVARWQRESGVQCRRVHQHLIEAGRVALLQVQADEIRVKAVGAVYWLASAMEVRSRLWLGGMISRHRDKELIRGLLLRVRCCGPLEKILLVTDGLSSYKSQALKIFREPIRTGKVGRPTLMLAAGVMVARVIKRYQRKRVVEVVREVVQGAQAAVISRVIGTQRSMVALINTLPTSSALTPPSESGWRRWRVGPAPGYTSAVRWRGECGWWALPTTSCGRSALSGRAAPRRWRRGSRIIAGRWRSC